MIWTQEQRDELVALWNSGSKTYSELAAYFGVSRSSIAGRMRREKHIRGLPIDESHAHNTRRTGLPRSERRKKKMFTLPARAEFVLSAYKVPDPRIPDEGQLASIVDVTGCKWPVRDDAEFVGGVAFCNYAVDGDKSYCPYHAQINVASFSRSLIRKTIKSALHLVKEKAA